MFSTKTGICQDNPRSIYCCPVTITLPVPNEKTIHFNYTGLKSKAISKTIFILHIVLLKLIQ